MAENKSIVEELEHNVHHGGAQIQNPYNDSKNDEIDALKNTIKFMNLEHKIAIQEKEIQNLTLQIENDLHQQIKVEKEKDLQILKLQHENEILKLKNNEADQKKNEYSNKILELALLI